ncbi:bifunctional [glutamate--ammonia ligase]-adenylyl-L-tyrosine phosphorylase/[glutamate--ammonia-ligase] adenylyltransferase [Sphingomonas xanthus]|uniref:Bifunctional [glutamate--ammonia ligase]-adenylyl-L-tyrosine phosphorylase/[glutamate--ammonia-ligase] adenylyltransferase n=1 Tax=Sphingomonas xanthus TaxID=2594473 RepID=A0A516IQG0_9SPHN|nr:bifunctional [glutamate--ammonia ligase]-adenylyl-L-tyrosine phosphorylase/[glutamate--ammonia-ligase] adenylyltransferase [Sphingomonas xanthus]QDP19137.1 bifunctional [glutamate--ammonia ligase]-adenylyl-L-tyrosine phosphorylase/[glutamate--ammonia-ligase] adenylyltransferase [Sphingomonas xanthus]
MKVTDPSAARRDALARARDHAPFLRRAAEIFPEVVEAFLAQGSEVGVRAALAADDDNVGARLRRQRHGLALAVALADLSGEVSLEWVSSTLSDFADSAMDQALRTAMLERVPDAEPRGIAVLALGKLGSHELNYSSDVDLVLLFDPATVPRRNREEPGESAVRIARGFIELMQQRTEDGYVARVDLRLRPSPEVTPIVLPADAAISYYESSALPWERAAFIRARAAAGDRALGESFLREIRPFIWRRALDFGAIDEIRDISLRIRDHYAQGQAFGPGFDLKRGRGGIREAEFFTQVFQLIHGGREPGLRSAATVEALHSLGAGGRLDPHVAEGIAAAYRALRIAEHRVQMIDDRQEHRLPVDPIALDQVARLDGLADGPRLVAQLGPHVEFVGLQFDGLVSKQNETLSNDPDILRSELSAIGFADVEAVQRQVSDWRSGRARSLRSPAARNAFEAMLPTLMQAIAAGPDPGHALNRFGDIVERLSSGVNLYRLLEARPKLADLLALILAHAAPLADQLGRRPTLLDGLIDDSSFTAPPDADALAVRFLRFMGSEPFDMALEQVRRKVGERRFALGVQLLAAHRDPIVIAEGYSDLAEAAVVALSAGVEAEFERSNGKVAGGELIILGLGRLGGRALTHASDLDLIYLFDAPEGAQSNGRKPMPATDYYNRLASRISAALGTPTAAGPLYEVDTRLRPQGAQGMLAVSIAAFEAYQRSDAWTWEHMALCRARPLTGSAAAKARVRTLIENILQSSTDEAKIRADAAAMRAEMARHKPPAGPLDIKLGPGGLVDLEFTVHTLQLTTHAGLDPRLEVAIAALVDRELIDEGADADLRLLSRMLVVLRLVGAKEMEPAEQSRQLVATLCGQPDWESLLAVVDAARQRIAARWAKVKGMSDAE